MEVIDGAALIARANLNAMLPAAIRRKDALCSHGGQHYPALVLNADFRPLSYFPRFRSGPGRMRVKAVFLDRVSVLNEYDTVVHSPEPGDPAAERDRAEGLHPRPPGGPAFTRFNVFLRDNFSCQYCLDRLPTHDLTFDHVIPRSRGGPHHLGERRHRLRHLQPAQGLAAAARVPDAPATYPRAAEHLGATG